MPLDIAAIERRRPHTKIVYHASTSSTMRDAAQQVAEGAPSGTIVLADEQTAGVGRMGRSWHSEPESGIYCSLVLRLPLSPAELPVAALMLGLATAEAIETTTNLACDLRWPNDVLINGKKACGILAQLLDGVTVAGIGINVNHTRLPENLRTPGTSLRLESGKVHSREDLICALLDSMDSFITLLASEGAQAIVRAFTAASSYAAHRRVFLEDTGQRGTTAGLDENGFLMVRLDSGQTVRLAAGGIRPEQ